MVLIQVTWRKLGKNHQAPVSDASIRYDFVTQCDLRIVRLWTTTAGTQLCVNIRATDFVETKGLISMQSIQAGEGTDRQICNIKQGQDNWSYIRRMHGEFSQSNVCFKCCAVTESETPVMCHHLGTKNHFFFQIISNSELEYISAYFAIHKSKVPGLSQQRYFLWLIAFRRVSTIIIKSTWWDLTNGRGSSRYRNYYILKWPFPRIA